MNGLAFSFSLHEPWGAGIPVPLNLTFRGVQIPVGLGFITLTLF